MKAAIISEYRYEQSKLKELMEQDVQVNYTLIPQFYASYNDELNKINHQLIKKAPAIIFRLEKLYASTKDAIEYALYLKKQVKIIAPDGTIYTNISKDEWKTSYTENNKQYTTKHAVLQMFDLARNEYFESKNRRKAIDTIEQATEGLSISEDECKAFVSIMSRQYKLDVDWFDTASLYNAYRNLQWYLEHDIDYALDKNEVFTVGVIEPEESGFFTKEMFDYNSNLYFGTAECESFGDETLFEDTIYKGLGGDDGCWN